MKDKLKCMDRKNYNQRIYLDLQGTEKLKDYRIRDLQHRKEVRRLFLKMYGGRCSCCGETKEEFLTIEHKNGQVKGKKEVGIVAYRLATKEYRPDLYCILCWNCNCSRGRYGYCPHQLNAEYAETNC